MLTFFSFFKWKDNLESKKNSFSVGKNKEGRGLSWKLKTF